AARLQENETVVLEGWHFFVGIQSEVLRRCTSISHSRNPHCTQAAQQCRLMACPRTAQRTEAYGPSVSLQWQAVGSIQSSRTGTAFFAVAISFALTLVRCLRQRSRGPWARSQQGGYQACDALAVMEKKPASCLCFGRRFRHCHTRNFRPPMFLPGSRLFAGK